MRLTCPLDELNGTYDELLGMAEAMHRDNARPPYHLLQFGNEHWALYATLLR